MLFPNAGNGIDRLNARKAMVFCQNSRQSGIEVLMVGQGRSAMADARWVG